MNEIGTWTRGRGVARFGLVTVVSLALSACGGMGGGPAEPTPQDAAATITPTDVATHMAYLASDAMRGRDTPSPELEQAARYLAEHFQEMGLEGGVDGEFIQRFPWIRGHLNADDVVLRVAGQDEGLTFGRDYFLVAGPTPLTSGPVVYAGVTGTDLSAVADALAGSVILFQIQGAELNAGWQQQLMGAMGRGVQSGAAAVGIVLDPEFPQQMVATVARFGGGQQAPVPLFGVLPGPAGELLSAAGADLGALEAAGTPSAVPGAVLEVGGTVAADSSMIPNVVAVLPGSDPELKDTYVVYSAHFDHVGVGQPDADGDSIFNGADDDASGTVALLEVAQAMAHGPRPARSQIFLAVSGEEKGLLGSAWYADHPTVPVESIVADINMDMIGRNAPDSVIAIGQEYSSLGPLTHQVAASHPDLGLTIAADMMPEERLFFRSDHFSFARNHIPAIFFTTGLHDQYHKPSDEPALIDNDKLARIARLVYWLGHSIATTPTAPSWTEDGWAEVQQMIAPNQPRNP